MKRTRKATQQINSIQYTNAASKPDRVAIDPTAPFNQVSDVLQGTAVDQCTGTQVYAKSLYVQAQFMISNQIYDDDMGVATPFVGSVFTNDLGAPLGQQRAYAAATIAKVIRFVVVLDRSPNGTNPRLSDVYKFTGVPNIKNSGRIANQAVTPSALVMLDPDKTRRFKIMMDQKVTVSLDNPVVHIEKYIPLNFYITYSGNNANNVDAAHIINNGLYILAFTESELTCSEATHRTALLPFYAFSSKMRFEP